MGKWIAAGAVGALVVIVIAVTGTNVTSRSSVGTTTQTTTPRAPATTHDTAGVSVGTTSQATMPRPSTTTMSAETLEPPPDWHAGSCVSYNDDDTVEPVRCTSQLAEGDILEVVESGNDCPVSTDWLVDLDDGLTACLDDWVAEREAATTSTTPTVPETTLTTTPSSTSGAQYSRNVDEWIGFPYDTLEIDDWPYLVVNGEATGLPSFGASHCLSEDCGWEMSYWGWVDEQRAYAIFGAPDGTIAAALEYDHAVDEYIHPPLCWDDFYGPVVFTHDSESLQVLHAWYVQETDNGFAFLHLPALDGITPVLDEYFVSGGYEIPPCR
jgi:hypothetical protein